MSGQAPAREIRTIVNSFLVTVRGVNRSDSHYRKIAKNTRRVLSTGPSPSTTLPGIGARSPLPVLGDLVPRSMTHRAAE